MRTFMRQRLPRMIALGLLVLVLTALVLVGGAQGTCCCGALLLVPSTDVVPYGAYSLELQQDSSADTQFEDTTRFANTEFGIAGNFEVGVDLDIGAEAKGKAIARNGDESSASVGPGYSFTEHSSLLTYAQFPDGSGDVVNSVHLVVCGKAC